MQARLAHGGLLSFAFAHPSREARRHRGGVLGGEAQGEAAVLVWGLRHRKCGGAGTQRRRGALETLRELQRDGAIGAG